ncbi:MAG TPA: LamG-like jellyroll fold domain-containing protein [Planctomycetota bacterium]|nr:LamG-like jellyroll fold domain-containing protein [Planctomycetota bacterium]
MRSFLACSLFVGTLCAQQEIVRYAFDSTDTNAVLNYASGPLAGPKFGNTTWPVEYVYADGRFGNALSASMYGGLSGIYVATGWQGGYQGALTIAFFLRNDIATSPNEYSPVAGQPNWSIATGGTAGAGLQLHGWGGPDLNGDFGVPVHTMPGWNHFAIVVDPVAGQATWYRNGVPATTTPISTGVVFTTGQLFVGADYVNWCGSLYDIDEFVMMGRAASPAEVALMAQAPIASVVPFGTVTNVAVQANSLPTAGNLNFALQVSGPANTLFLLAAGSSYAQAGAVALPLDLGPILGASGQFLRVSPDVSVAGVLLNGMASLPLPLPDQPQLLGVQLFVQAIALTGGSFVASNGLAVRVGRANQ